MENLFTIYKTIFNDNNWKYYGNLYVNPFASNESSKNFIKNFIKLSGKDAGNQLYERIEDLKDEMRIKHIVSTFFLGIYLYNNISTIKESVDKIVSRYQGKIQAEACRQGVNVDIQFSFFWYLICLFHDLGYVIEKSEYYDSFESFIKKQKIKYCLWKQQSRGIPLFYKKIFANYFAYRLKNKDDRIKGTDHGIAGGIILFDDLKRILKKELKNKNQHESNESGLYWGKDLVLIFNLTSWVILSHNIYYTKSNNETKNRYEANNLNELILKDRKKKISMKRHPFLFLFSLVDSIEPIKVFEEYNELEKFEIECENDKIIIRIQDEELFNKYSENIEGKKDDENGMSLKDWLVSDVQVNKSKNDLRIEIKL